MTRNDELQPSGKISMFEAALHKLSLTKVEQQNALLQILQMENLLTPEDLWESMYLINQIYPFAGDYISAFHKINEAIQLSHATTDDYQKFKVDILLNKLKEVTELSDQDFLRLIVYTSQNSFARKSGQERDQIPINKYRQWSKDRIELFVELSHQLGSVSNKFLPQNQNYDVCVILGTTLPTMYSRIMHFNFLNSCQDYRFNEVFMLVGERELCLNLDCLSREFIDEVRSFYAATNTHFHNNIVTSPKVDTTSSENNINYSKEIITIIAEQNDIKLGTPKFITNSNERIIPNYTNKDQIGALTETLGAKYYLQQLGIDNQVKIVSTPMNGKLRPTTVTTVETFAKQFINDLKHKKYNQQKEFSFLVVSNDPYSNRQLISLKRVMRDILKDANMDTDYKINYEVVSSPSNIEVYRVSSANAAYILETYQMVENESPFYQQGIDAPSAKLQYQYRAKHYDSLRKQIPPAPNTSNTSFFDPGIISVVAFVICVLGLIYVKFYRR